MDGIKVYRENAITTQGRGRLIVLLYEGAIRFLKQAVADLQNNDMAGKGRNINKAKDVLYELGSVLDAEQGGEIAENLKSLYNFMQHHLNQANLRKDVQMIQEVITLLEELNQGWRAISQ